MQLADLPKICYMSGCSENERMHLGEGREHPMSTQVEWELPARQSVDAQLQDSPWCLLSIEPGQESRGTGVSSLWLSRHPLLLCPAAASLKPSPGNCLDTTWHEGLASPCGQPGWMSTSQRVKDTPDVKNLSQGFECKILLVWEHQGETFTLIGFLYENPQVFFGCFFSTFENTRNHFSGSSQRALQLPVRFHWLSHIFVIFLLACAIV